MNVAPCALPADTFLDRELVDGAFLIDSWRAGLRNGDASVVDIFFAVLGHQPAWLKVILLARIRVGGWFGLHAATATTDVMSPTRRETYRVGETIGRWPIFFLGESELIAGRDDKHLDFRVSVLKAGTGENVFAIVSTVCRPHNRFGRMYLRTVAPLHRWGVRHLLSAAIQKGRL